MIQGGEGVGAQGVVIAGKVVRGLGLVDGSEEPAVARVLGGMAGPTAVSVGGRVWPPCTAPPVACVPTARGRAADLRPNSQALSVSCVRDRKGGGAGRRPRRRERSGPRESPAAVLRGDARKQNESENRGQGFRTGRVSSIMMSRVDPAEGHRRISQIRACVCSSTRTHARSGPHPS
jgi:hypothetical protein